MKIATMTSKGQVTLPKDLRAELGLKKGDRVSFERGTGGWVLKREAAGVRSDGAAVRYIRRKDVLSVDDMKRAARAAAAEHYRGEDKR